MDLIAHLLNIKFDETCTKHDRAKIYFCKECLSDSFCDSCLNDSRHRDHGLLQVFNASRKEVVRVEDIEKFSDVSNIQPFEINAKTVVYIYTRETKGDPGCSICGGHKLDKRYAFCSIACQFRSLQLEEGNKRCDDDDDKSIESRVASSSSSSSSMYSEASNSNNDLPLVKQRRKGRPSRAPLR